MARRRRLRSNYIERNSVGNKITEKDSDILSICLLNFSEKYSFSDELMDFFFYLVRIRNTKTQLEEILDIKIRELLQNQKLHFTKSAKKRLAVIKTGESFKNQNLVNATRKQEFENEFQITEESENLEEIPEENLIDYYFSHKQNLPSSNFDREIFVEDDDCFDDVCFRTGGSRTLEDLARVFSLLGEKEILNIITFALFPKNKTASSKKFSVPSRAINNFYDFSKLQIIIDFASLNENESLVLKFFYYHKKFSVLSSLEDNINTNNRNEFYSTIIGIPETDFINTIRKDKALLFYGIIKENKHSGFFELSDEVSTCISAGNTNSFFTSVLRETEVEPYDLKSFSCNEENIEIIQNLLKSKQSLNILLYGAPGSGKTEFAKSIIKSTGKKILAFKNDLELDESENVICALNRISIVNQGSDCVILIDEADKLLDTAEHSSLFGTVSNEQKGPINKMLESSKNQIIWITNYVSQIDESTKRRFTFSMKFNPMSGETLKNITKSKIADVKMSENMRNKILDLCTKYNVTGASVENVRKLLLSIDSQNPQKNFLNSQELHSNLQINSCAENQNHQNLLDISEEEEAKLEQIKIILAANSELLNGKAKMREKQCDAYDINVLNTSMDANKIVQMILNAKKFEEKNKISKNGIRILFYGLSGTGKTEFARYIADKIDKKILIKRASDIFNPYVGMSEKNIASAFAQAESSGSILLFDEADSFFSNRENLSKSWERNTVNEFLTQMEEFTGILICTTNLREILDPAINRRFHLLCEFKPITERGIKTLLNKYFSGIKFSQNQIQELAQTNSLTPGDFASLYARLRFMDEKELNAKNITHELLNMQKEKQSSDYYGKKIGFGH